MPRIMIKQLRLFVNIEGAIFGPNIKRTLDIELRDIRGIRRRADPG